MQSPILLIFFNRPSTLRRVFDRIREAKPSKLYLACDGARLHHGTDEQNIILCKEIVSSVDWDCKVYTLYQKKNLGCKYGPYTAMSWFFQYEEQGIILEDDCLPHSHFFDFCNYFLDYYKNDQRIYHINGTNAYLGRKKIPETYYFSQRNNSYGWATWRRAWKDFDIEMKHFPILRKSTLDTSFSNRIVKWYYDQKWAQVHNNTISTAWDYQWFFHILYHRGLCVTPQKNLVSNIGFDPKQGTHTSSPDHLYADIPAYGIPLDHVTHPISFCPRIDIDNYVFFLGVIASSYTVHITKYVRTYLHNRLKNS